MEDWKVRLVEEYKQLLERMEKLSIALNKEEFYEKVDRVQHFYMVSQYTGMRIYKEALEDRLKDLGIKVE
jgi:predicted glycosyltransferase involved in capsule biosynthesis